MATDTVHSPRAGHLPHTKATLRQNGGNVIDLREFKARERNAELTAELEELLALARQGRLAGIAYCFQTPRGTERVGFIGNYKGDAARMLLAATHFHNHAQCVISGEGR